MTEQTNSPQKPIDLADQELGRSIRIRFAEQALDYLREDYMDVAETVLGYVDPKGAVEDALPENGPIGGLDGRDVDIRELDSLTTEDGRFEFLADELATVITYDLHLDVEDSYNMMNRTLDTSLFARTTYTVPCEVKVRLDWTEHQDPSNDIADPHPEIKDFDVSVEKV